ncbi:MAG: LLM class flavin-dependent oxidoreductase [Chloroflexota bacterium]|nr:LLM class flavin-dependent oxidoreductase [Chloroflexota bacterium]MEC9287146.1 LLM class flavin-dependent oxidoreductase [Chloroflexota bacterium]
MHFGAFMEFGNRDGVNEAQAFQEGFRLVDAAEEMGLDGVWLAELHFNPARSVLSSPIVVATSIATRTKRLRIGMAVYVLPLSNPLRIAEEVATVDHISEGRFEFGIGRSGFARSYDVFSIPYIESQERFAESLKIILQAWEGKEFSYHGKHYNVESAIISPVPYQKPHPPLRVAANSPDTFVRLGEAGRPIFVGLRGMDIPELQENVNRYRRSWKEAGHDGEGDVSLRIPVYAGETMEQAMDEPFESISGYFGRMGNLYRERAGKAGLDATELSNGRADQIEALSYEDMLETKIAFGTAESLVDRFTQLKEELGLDGVVAELNAGGLIPEERVLRSLRIVTEKVMPVFK